MSKFSNWLFAVVLLSTIFTACQSRQEAASPEENIANTEATNAKAVEPVGVLNANLATEADLRAIGLPAEMITQILENRPFVTMNDLDTLLATTADKAALYRVLFVPMNLNTTPEADFKMIPGVGDRMAHEFEEYRPYTSIQQFRREIGKYVDEEEVARYEQYVFVPVELNTASEADIKALPGVGDRMAHEFEEYRPYTSMEQFRREIGKYVDDKELARLERLVYIAE